jgi:3-methylcrotonyl-CoA carboxylase alpha subunit/geranyl-CoA carboxylase alpha subunit
MLAKIIAYGPDRQVAAQRLSAALGDFAILGITSSQAFLRDIVDHPTFRAGKLTTRFIAETFPDGWNGATDDTHDLIAAAALWAQAREADRAASSLGPWATLGGFRVSAAVGWVSLDVTFGPERIPVELSGGGGKYAFRRDGTVTPVEITVTGNRATLSIDGVARDFRFAIDGQTIDLGRNATSRSVTVTPRIANAGGKAAAQGAGAGHIDAPMPGLISKLNVVPGQMVAEGDTVIVMEAMKLMYSLPAQISGRIAEIFCAEGDTVAGGAPLVEIVAENN